MTRNEWIKKAFEECKYKKDKVIGLYKRFKRELNTKTTTQAYIDLVNKIAKELEISSLGAKQKKSDWVKDCLRDNNLDPDAVLKLYSVFVERFESPMTMPAFKAYINKNLQQMKRNPKKRKRKVPLTQKEIMELLSRHTLKKGKRLTVSDVLAVADENGMEFSEFTVATQNNLSKVLSNIYNEIFCTTDHKVEIHNYKDEISRIKKENRELIEKTAIEEKIISKLDFLSREFKPLKIKLATKPQPARDREGVLLLSDFHFDEVVEPESVMGLNSYNPAIAAKRLQSVFDQCISDMHELSCKKLLVFLGGDLVSGEIHEELVETNEGGISRTTLQLYDLLVQGIYELTKLFDVRVVCVVGNHGRTTKKPRFKNAFLKNFEYILYGFMEKGLRNVVTDFRMPERVFEIVDIMGYKVYFCHGDTFKSGSGFATVSNLIPRDVSKISGLFRKLGIDKTEIDYVCMGHFHTAAEIMSFDGIGVILNGSLMGTNEYSMHKVKAGSEASQSFFVIERGKGLKFRDVLKVGGIR